MHCRVTDKAQTVLLDETLSLHSDGTYLRSRELVLSNITPWCHETPELYRVTLLEETRDLVSIRYTFTAPAMPGLITEVTYTVDSNCMDVNVHYYGGAGRPQLPLLGLRFATPAPVEKVEWIGLSGETYPDRKKGGFFGKHREAPHIPDFLVPQECGCHIDTHQTTLHLSNRVLTMEKTDMPYAFSAIPYTPPAAQ